MRSILLVFLVSTVVAIVRNNISSPYTVLNFVIDIHKIERFQQVLILQPQNKSIEDTFGIDQRFIQILSNEIPVIIYSNSSFYLKANFSKKHFTLVFFDQMSGSSLLSRMVEILRNIILSKVLIVFERSSQSKVNLTEIFNNCLRNRVINVAAVFGDFPDTKQVFSLRLAPHLEIAGVQAVKGLPITSYFPNRSGNFQGRSLRIAYVGVEPKIILSKNHKNETIIKGNIAHFLETLAKKHNLTLVRSIVDTENTPAGAANLAFNGTVDISTGLYSPGIPTDNFTYPFEYINWCVMLPIEPSIPRYNIFLVVFRLETLLITIGLVVLLSVVLERSKQLAGAEVNLLEFIINDDCLRGVLGQSFTEMRKASLKIRYIYLLICLLGIILTTSYNSFLQTYVTSPPTIPKIRSFDDLLLSGIKVYCLEEEFEELKNDAPDFGGKYFNIFTFESSFSRYIINRDKLDTKYAYMVNQIKWITIQELQKIFTKPLFRQQEGMCFFDYFPIAFPVGENSIFIEVINFLMLETQASGLQEHWHRKSFQELIESGKIKLKDLAGNRMEFVPMEADHLRLVWIGLSAGLLVASLCFLGEVLIFRWRKIKKNSMMGNML